jgi:hypothetical protein
VAKLVREMGSIPDLSQKSQMGDITRPKKLYTRGPEGAWSRLTVKGNILEEAQPFFAAVISEIVIFN